MVGNLWTSVGWPRLGRESNHWPSNMDFEDGTGDLRGMLIHRWWGLHTVESSRGSSNLAGRSPHLVGWFSKLQSSMASSGLSNCHVWLPDAYVCCLFSLPLKQNADQWAMRKGSMLYGCFWTFVVNHALKGLDTTPCLLINSGRQTMTYNPSTVGISPVFMVSTIWINLDKLQCIVLTSRRDVTLIDG